SRRTAASAANAMSAGNEGPARIGGSNVNPVSRPGYWCRQMIATAVTNPSATPNADSQVGNRALPVSLAIVPPTAIASSRLPVTPEIVAARRLIRSRRGLSSRAGCGSSAVVMLRAYDRRPGEWHRRIGGFRATQSRTFVVVGFRLVADARNPHHTVR